jgi:hypothetical protein
MSDPFRLRVLKAMTTVLQGITPGNGYQHDLSGTDENLCVFRGRDTFSTEDPLPMVSVLEHPSALDVVQSKNGTTSAGGWQLLVQGFVRDDIVNPSDPAYFLAADVIKALSAEITRDNGHNIFGLGFARPSVKSIKIGSPVCRPPDGVNADVAFFWLTVELSLSEDLENPYA